MMKQDVIQNGVQQVSRPRRLSWSDLGGATLLFIGLTFIVANLLGAGRLENWWGLFILLPGLLFVGLGWQAQLQQAQLAGNGRFPFIARFSMGVGLVVLMVAILFLLNLNWGTWWPLMIVMPGVALWLVGGADGKVGVTAVLRFLRWIGLTMILLGFTFLADQLAFISLPALFGDFHWWGIFILIPGVGAFVEALRVIRRATWTATAMLIVGVWILSTGVMQLLDPNWISWEGMVGIGLIGTGLMSRVWLMFQPVTE
ncbi:MAG: hypothetical protein H6667_15650 [Ardenticatenaceae bacterium]|nr:hypothetical protein [Ardenticatenaceae bacterium]